MARKPTSDEQFGVLEDGDEEPTDELQELFDHHGFSVYELEIGDDDGEEA